jgi:hypothetical protein
MRDGQILKIRVRVYLCFGEREGHGIIKCDAENFRIDTYFLNICCKKNDQGKAQCFSISSGAKNSLGLPKAKFEQHIGTKRSFLLHFSRHFLFVSEISFFGYGKLALVLLCCNKQKTTGLPI